MRLIDADALIKALIRKEPFSDCARVVIAECMEEVRHAPTIKLEPQWIPVSDRPPEEDGEYLVLYHIQSKYKPYVYDVRLFANDLYKIDEYDFYDKKGQKGWVYYDREYGFCEDDSVIAWMPLPEPYREKVITNDLCADR